MGIGVDGLSADSFTKNVYTKYSDSPIDTNVEASDTTSYLDFDGYLQLLVAQMSNQDFNDPMSDSEFIQQMASYSMMESIKQLSTQTAVSYASSLIGKAVTVDGDSGMDSGVVEAVTVSDGTCSLVVNGNHYATSTITDIIDGDTYKALNSLVGYTATLSETDSDGNNLTGKVTSIYIRNGSGYVVIDNKSTYSVNSVLSVDKAEDSGNTEADSTEEADEAAESSETANAADSSEAAYESSDINALSAAYAVDSDEVEGVTSAQSSYEILLKMLDDREENSLETASVTSALDSISSYSSLTVSDIIAASGLSSDSDLIPDPIRISNYSSYSDSNNDTLANSVSGSAAAVAYDNGDEEGVTYAYSTVADSQAQSKMTPLETLSSFSAVSTRTGVPASTRKYADSYPVEAAYADKVRTNMVDIRFISNTDITSEINTSKILCYSEKGYPVTDIGFSGVGRLGEVITWADGTQRVEIIGPNSSTYLTTTGNYTLDEICDFNAAPGSLAGKLSPFETAIRYWARTYSEEEIANMESFGEYCARLSVGLA